MNIPKIHHQISEHGQIRFVLADKNYTVFYLENGRKFVSGYTLKFHENYFDLEKFMRINRSMLVNKSYISTIKADENASYVVMKNGEGILIPRRRLKDIQQQCVKIINSNLQLK